MVPGVVPYQTHLSLDYKTFREFLKEKEKVHRYQVIAPGGNTNRVKWDAGESYRPFGMPMSKPALHGMLSTLKSLHLMYSLDGQSQKVFNDILDDENVKAKLSGWKLVGSDYWHAVVSTSYARLPNYSVVRVLPSLLTACFDAGEWINSKIHIHFHMHTIGIEDPLTGKDVPFKVGYTLINSEAGDSSFRIHKVIYSVSQNASEKGRSEIVAFMDPVEQSRFIHRGDILERAKRAMNKIRKDMDVDGIKEKMLLAQDTRLGLHLFGCEKEDIEEGTEKLAKKLRSAGLQKGEALAMAAKLFEVEEKDDMTAELYEVTAFRAARMIAEKAKMKYNREDLEKVAFKILMNPESMVVKSEEDEDE